MSVDEVHARAPIAQILRKSPFEGLQEHFRFVKGGIKALEKTINCYLKCNYSEFQICANVVYKYEHEADLVKGNIRNHLPKFIFIPIDKSDFLALLKETDGILDGAEDVTVLMEMRKTEVPMDIKKDFQALVKKQIQTINTLGKGMELLKVMLESSFGGKPRQSLKNIIHKIHRLEHESDLIEKRISRKMFNNEKLDPISIMHILKIVDRMGTIADHAENAADRIRAMIAK